MAVTSILSVKVMCKLLGIHEYSLYKPVQTVVIFNGHKGQVEPPKSGNHRTLDLPDHGKFRTID
ncbi:hypothetical protein E2C01_077885 [Portunus trituberculatus]|uniref:Uncharacterized protein n=1 Tax=Portunus trituberculatus TaxID=210409 RepID=A0A5B7ILE7_PORTR|nr:hypothetical protein [Portunus trituberculatus]